MYLRSCLLALALLGATPVLAEDAKPFPQLARAVGEILVRQYYDQGRFDPELMIRRALRAFETAELPIRASWQDGHLSLTGDRAAVLLELPTPTDVPEAMALIDAVRAAFPELGVAADRQRDLGYALINGALGSLDPHTLVMPPEPADSFAEEIEGEFFGIGAYLNQQDGIVRIERVMSGLPAEQAGVRDGDVILGVDDENVVGLSLTQVVNRIKGPKGTTVALSIERDGALEPLTINVVRDRVRIVTMRSFRQDGIGYLRMDEFNRGTARALWDEVLALRREGELDGLVLDLRFNSGGLLSQAYQISDFFLPQGREVVRTVGADGGPGSGRVMESSRRQLLTSPMIVLVGPGSASAAEILAGSLQLNQRAVIAGRETFGKGTVQTLRRLPDGSQLKLTIQDYQLAGGISIQRSGIVPDLALPRRTVDGDGTVDLLPYSLRREADGEFALGGSGQPYEISSTLVLPWLADHEDEERSRRHRISSRDFAPDQEAQLCIDLLAEAVAGSEARPALQQALAEGRVRELLLEKLRKPAARRSTDETLRLAEAIDAVHPDLRWGESVPAAHSPDLAAVWLGPDEVVPGETATLRLRVDNRSGQPVGRLYAMIHADQWSPLWEEEMLIGTVPANGSSIAELAFAVPPRLAPGSERFELRVHQDGRPGEVLATAEGGFTVQAAPRPHLGYRWQLLDAERIELDRPHSLRLHVINSGEAASVPALLYVMKDDDAFLHLEQGRFQLPALAPGEEASVDLDLTLRSEAGPEVMRLAWSGESITLQLRAEERFGDGVDGRLRASFTHVLRLPVGAELEPATFMPPRIQILGLERDATDRGELHLRVDDDDLRAVAVFRGDDKVEVLLPDRLDEDGSARVRVDLEPGLNLLRVVAIDRNDLTSALPLRLWGPEPLDEDGPVTGEARSVPQTPGLPEPAMPMP